MSTVGQILKEARELKNYDLETVEKKTKIRKELLISLESDDYNNLPPRTFVQGFIKNYASFLDLDSEKVMAIFRREFADRKHSPYVMDAFSNPVEESKVIITPSRVIGTVVALIILTFFAYLWFQYRQYIHPPNLVITSPTDQMTTSNPNLIVEGKTDPEISITINNQSIPVDVNGDFKQSIILSSQVNRIVIVATSWAGKDTEVDRTVYLK